MADHDLVQRTLDFLANNWNEDKTFGRNNQLPVVVDRDDAEVYEITSSGTQKVGDAEVGVSFLQREVAYDLTDNNAISVGSDPSRTEDVVGTEYDYDVEDGVTVRVEAATDQGGRYGHVEDAGEFQTLYREARRAILVERTWPYRNPSGDIHWRDLRTANTTSGSIQHADYYRYEFDVLFRGYEELP